jgi:hypothetical protein
MTTYQVALAQKVLALLLYLDFDNSRILNESYRRTLSYTAPSLASEFDQTLSLEQYT